MKQIVLIFYKLSENRKEAKFASLCFEAGITFISKRTRPIYERKFSLSPFFLAFYIYVYKKVTKWIQQGVFFLKTFHYRKIKHIEKKDQTEFLSTHNTASKMAYSWIMLFHLYSHSSYYLEADSRVPTRNVSIC